MLPPELTNTIEQFVVYVHRNEAHFIYNIYKNHPPNVISPIFFAIFTSLWGSTHDSADCWSAYRPDAMLGGVGRVPPLPNKNPGYTGACRNRMHELGYIASPLCDCGKQQTMRHIVNECLLTRFDGGISELHLAQDAAFNWLLRRNMKANDNNIG